ncbi:MAG: outer membrane beta-barrel protein [Bacteroidota bacterium]
MERRSFFLITIHLLISLSVFSQPDKSAFGVTAGVNVSYIAQRGSTTFVVYEPTALFGLNAGVSYRRVLSKAWAIRSELFYITKGGDFGIAGTSRYHYMNLPILVQFSPFKNFQIESGLEPAGLIGVGNNFLGDYPFINKWDLSGVLGASYWFQKKFEFAVRYGYGFVPVEEITFTNASGALEGTAKDFNRYVRISIGYYFVNQVD